MPTKAERESTAAVILLHYTLNEIRRPKSEGPTKAATRNPSLSAYPRRPFRFEFRTSAFFRPSDFGLRISPPARTMTALLSRLATEPYRLLVALVAIMSF